MKKTGKCPKCDSTDIIADAKAIDRKERGEETELSIATYRNPDALIFKEKETSTLSAWVCAECGFVEFYADDTRTIRVPRR